MPEVVFVFCHCLIVSCSGSGEKVHPKTLCGGVNEKVTSVLLDDMVGAVNFCCECRMVSGECRVEDWGLLEMCPQAKQLLRLFGK